MSDAGLILIALFALATFILIGGRRAANSRYYLPPTAKRAGLSGIIDALSASGRLPAQGKNILAQNFEFYRRLSTGQQKIFARRVGRFIADKTFEGRDNLSVTLAMKVLIAATAMRVSWGLRYYLFPSFHTILIYPEQFYSGFSKAVVKGETNMAGVVVFSWKDFLFGLSDGNDNLNLGYHEFGHALFVERFKETIDDQFIENYDQWRRFIFQNGKLKEAELKHTFRQYATYNEHEFFAVAIENFFERPEKFKTDLPRLYRIMALMLNQDPLHFGPRYHQGSF